MAVFQVLHKINSLNWNTDRQRWEAATIPAYAESDGGPIVEVTDLPDTAVALPSLDPEAIHAACHAWAVSAVARRHGGELSALIGPVFVEAGTEYTPAP
jgi:hypothetical protein